MWRAIAPGWSRWWVLWSWNPDSEKLSASAWMCFFLVKFAKVDLIPFDMTGMSLKPTNWRHCSAICIRQLFSVANNILGREVDKLLLPSKPAETFLYKCFHSFPNAGNYTFKWTFANILYLCKFSSWPTCLTLACKLILQSALQNVVDIDKLFNASPVAWHPYWWSLFGERWDIGNGWHGRKTKGFEGEIALVSMVSSEDCDPPVRHGPLPMLSIATWWCWPVFMGSIVLD